MRDVPLRVWISVSLLLFSTQARLANQIQGDDQIQWIQLFWRKCLCFPLNSGSDPAYKRFLLIVVSYCSPWDEEMWGLKARWKERAQRRSINSRTEPCVCVWLTIEESGSKDPRGYWHTHTHKHTRIHTEVIASFKLAKLLPRQMSTFLNYMSQIIVYPPEEFIQISQLQHMHRPHSRIHGHAKLLFPRSLCGLVNGLCFGWLFWSDLSIFHPETLQLVRLADSAWVLSSCVIDQGLRRKLIWIPTRQWLNTD